MYTVFVYGTLRKGESNHSIIEEANLKEKHCWTTGELYDTGAGYPALFQSGEGVVYGELYEVDDKLLARIDVLEGFQEGRKANLYERVIQPIETPHKQYKAITYIMNTTSSSFQRIATGDWVSYRLNNDLLS